MNKTEDMIKTLIEVCSSNDVLRQNKTIAISIIGHIVLFAETDFSPYLETIMKLLFSAAKLGFNLDNNYDEDLIEFVKSLRYELIQTFTCIELTFNDNQNKDILTPFIQDIFAFLKSCVDDKNIQTLDINGLFIAVGQTPKNEIFANIIKLDTSGYIESEDGVHTNIKGIYVAGDTRVKQLRQLTTAVSDGAIAATIAIKEME